MRAPVLTLRGASLILVAMLIGTLPLLAENKVVVDCPTAVPAPDGDSVGIPIYFSNDVELGGLSIGFHYNSDDVECTSIDYSGSYWIDSHGFQSPLYLPDQNMVLVGWVDFSGSQAIPIQDGGLMCVLWFQIPAGTSPQCVDIDSTFVPPAGDFLFALTDGSDLIPNYYDCGAGDINIGNMPDCYPPVVSDIPDQILPEDTPFATINLDDYVEDGSNPDNEISWTFSGNTELNVWIDGSRVAHIEAPFENWNGSETVTFTATDPNDLFDSDDATFEWTPVNDPPEVADIPGQTVPEGSTFATFDLDNYVTDPDNSEAEISWSWSGNSQLSVSIDPNHVATVSIPNPDWYGSETITFRATDPGSLFDNDPAVFTVTNINDQPVVADIPGQTIPEGGSFVTINLDDYVDDVDNTDAEMDWTYSGNTELSVSIVSRVATITTPHADWFGYETILFRAEDPGGLFDDDPAPFEVTNTPDDPVAPDTTVNTDEDVDLVATLPGYDVDLEAITWTVITGPTNGSLPSFNPATGDYTYDPDLDYSGPDQLTYEVSDGKGTPDTGVVDINVAPINDAPVVGDIPNQTIPEGDSFTLVNLDDYVTDVDNTVGEMDWTYSGNSALSVSIDGSNVATITTPDPDWFGAESITFTATDPGDLSDGDPATFTVTNLQDAPVAPDTTVIATEDVDLSSSLPGYDVDLEALTWAVLSGPDHGTLSSFSSATGNYIYDPDQDYFGADQMTYEVVDGVGDADTGVVDINIAAVNDPPVVIDPDDQLIAEGGSFATFDLDDLVSDVDNSITELGWTYSGNSQLSIGIDGDNVVTITTPDPDWFGEETITFRATDPWDDFGEGTATFTVSPVNDDPVVSDIPDQTVPEGSSFATIALDSYVTDIDDPDAQIDWQYSGNSELTVSIDGAHMATITIPNPDWFGTETITFTATDTAGASAGDPAVFAVTAVNDQPVVDDIPDQTLGASGEFEQIDLNLFVDDVDDPDLDIIWTYSGNVDLIVTIDGGNIATVALPSPTWFGVETITFRATDPGGLFDEDAAEFNGLLCGDCDGDGMANISDAVFVIAYIFMGGPAPVVYSAADVNCDGTVNISDVVYLLDWIFRGGPEPCADC
jgi:hypothetical protein